MKSIAITRFFFISIILVTSCEENPARFVGETAVLDVVPSTDSDTQPIEIDAGLDTGIPTTDQTPTDTGIDTDTESDTDTHSQTDSETETSTDSETIPDTETETEEILCPWECKQLLDNDAIFTCDEYDFPSDPAESIRNYNFACMDGEICCQPVSDTSDFAVTVYCPEVGDTCHMQCDGEQNKNAYCQNAAVKCCEV